MSRFRMFYLSTFPFLGNLIKIIKYGYHNFADDDLKIQQHQANSFYSKCCLSATSVLLLGTKLSSESIGLDNCRTGLQVPAAKI